MFYQSWIIKRVFKSLDVIFTGRIDILIREKKNR